MGTNINTLRHAPPTISDGLFTRMNGGTFEPHLLS